MQSKMQKSTVSLLLIFIAAFSLFPTNDALNQAQCLNKLTRSRHKIANMLSHTSSTVHTDLSELSAPINSYQRLRNDDQIKALPGQPKGVDFVQYSGYVTVDKKNGKELFYYFVKSPNNSSTNPLILWLNGGPGCSSLGYGAMEEVGPFRVNKDGKTLSRNKYAWNNVANVLFVESPAGVGFSKSNTNVNGDGISAKESYIFLGNWLRRFPDFKKRDFFLAGESYAGHYIPQLADLILSENNRANRTYINLKGVMIGNPYIDQIENQRAQFEFYWHHGFITDEVYESIGKNCNFANDNEFKECDDAINEVDLGNIDEYNVYAPLCLDFNNGTIRHADESGGVDPCMDIYVDQYLNDPKVMKAFHVHQNSTWSSCVDLNYTDHAITIVPTFKKIIQKGLRVWLYSGDIDSIVPFTGTRNSVKTMKFPIKKSWRPWLSNQQVGGYVEEYEGVTLATVRGSGHMVPLDQPRRAFDLFTYFLRGISLPEMPQD